MNCADLRERLPLLVYGDLGAEETRQADSHLADCPACQHEREALIATKEALDSATVPEVAIDLAAIHGQALAMQARSMRRWQRFAIATGSLAACLTAFLLIRPDVRVGDGQLVIRWNSTPEQPRVVERVATNVQAPSPPLRDPDLEDRIRVLSDLVQVLTLQMENNDQQRREELELLIARLDVLRVQSHQRWDETKRDVSALYTAQFGRREQ